MGIVAASLGGDAHQLQHLTGLLQRGLLALLLMDADDLGDLILHPENGI